MCIHVYTCTFCMLSVIIMGVLKMCLCITVLLYMCNYNPIYMYRSAGQAADTHRGDPLPGVQAGGRQLCLQEGWQDLQSAQY